MIIGLTGPTGSGKSTFSCMLEEKGFYIINCDSVAREVVEKGSPLLDVLAEAFSEEILNSDGTLNRKKLAELAFCDKESTELLNSIMLPYIADRIGETVDGLVIDGINNILLDAPTLFESGIDSICDCVVAVLCDRKIRRQRIIERDNLTDEQADVRLNASKPDDFYLERTKFVIYNDGTKEQFVASAEKVFGEIFK